MNEMELLTRMREEVPLSPVSPRAEETFFAGLREPVTRTGKTRKGGPVRRIRPTQPRWRLALAGGLSLTVAAGVAGGVSLATRGSSTPGPTQSPVSVKLLVDDAARAAIAGPSVSPHQWIYNKVLFSGIVDGKIQANVGWTTADNTQWAFYSGHRLLRAPWPIGGTAPAAHWPDGKPNLGDLILPYRTLNTLPPDPAKLLGYLRRITGPVQTPGLWRSIVFTDIGNLFTYYVMPPHVAAELYRAIALIPGVRVNPDAVDLAGQRGTGLTCSGDEIILNSHSYQFMGTQGTSPQTAKIGVAIVSRALVSGPGVRP
jgi:hypothetical protein